MLRRLFCCCSSPPPANERSAAHASTNGGQYEKSQNVAAHVPQDLRGAEVETKYTTGEQLSRLRSRTELTLFSYEDLRLATNNFAESLGRGGFGQVFKGELPASRRHGRLAALPIAVKCLSAISDQGFPEFEAELHIFTHIRHKNLVRLIGWCLEGISQTDGATRVVLVYEFMPNGNLEDLLYHTKRGKQITWPARFEIVKKIGETLLYLHEHCTEEPILHRDIKCTNILLDENYNPKLGDFGLSRKVEKGMSYYQTGRACAPLGTRGYIAPEVLVDEKFTKETDMYSFGVVLLQVASGRRPLDCIDSRFHIETGCNQPLIESVWDLHRQKRLLEAADRRLHHLFNDGEMRRVLLVGLACCHPDSQSRLNIREAVDVLSGNSHMLPCLPSSMPRLSSSIRRAVDEADATTASCSTNYATARIHDNNI